MEISQILVALQRTFASHWLTGFYLPCICARTHSDRHAHLHALRQTCRHAHGKHTHTQKARHNNRCWLRAVVFGGVASAGIFTALIANINSLSSIHPLSDLLDCSICVKLLLQPLQVRYWKKTGKKTAPRYS